MTSKTEKQPTPTADPVALARAEVERLNDAERDRSKLFGIKATELAAKRAQRGDVGLREADPDGARRESSRAIVVMAEELDALRDEADAARRQRMKAIPAVFKAEADELERQAAQRDVDASKNEAEVEEALKEVRRRAGCNYVPASELAFARRGQLGGGSGSLSVMGVVIPRYQQLQNEATALRLAAAQRRIKEPERAGSVEAATIDELVDKVFGDPMREGPSVDATVAWTEKAIDLEHRRRKRIQRQGGDAFVPVDAPITKLHLDWRAGQIDVASSWVASQSPLATAVVEIDTEAEFAAAAATDQSA